MNKTLRNLLVAAACASMIAFVFKLLAALVNAPGLGEARLTLGAAIGILTFFILHLRGASRRAPPADADAWARALAFVCPPDRALVYFVRSGFAGGAVGVDIDVDGKTVVQIKSPRFTCLTLAPGTRTFEAHVGDGRSSLAPASAQMSTRLTAGSVTLLHIAIKRSMLKTMLAFDPWTLDTAKVSLQAAAMCNAMPYFGGAPATRFHNVLAPFGTILSQPARSGRQ